MYLCRSSSGTNNGLLRLRPDTPAVHYLLNYQYIYGPTANFKDFVPHDNFTKSRKIFKYERDFRLMSFV